jgi:two-component SAPR family response regulator
MILEYKGMKILIADDESLAVELLKMILSDFEFVEIVGAYTDIIKAIEFTRHNEVDAVFLDIEMPQITGIDAANAFRNIKPDIEVVFVTGHSKFAVMAYEIDAIDYILKPVSESRVEKTLERINRKVNLISSISDNRLKSIRCFGDVGIIFNKGTNDSVKWRTSKTKELFCFLVHNRDTMVSRNRVLETLWPYMSKDKAAALLSTTIYNMRQLIKNLEIEDYFEFSSKGYKFLTNKLKCDFIEFEEVISSFDEVDNSNINSLEDAIKLYSGDYFEDNDFVWAIFEKERLKNLYINTLKKMANYYVNKTDYNKALVSLKSILIKNPLLEEVNELVMEVYALMGDFKAAENQYRSYYDISMEELGIEPSPKMKKLLYGLFG